MKNQTMTPFQYHNNALWAESCSVSDIIAAVGTPCFIYSKAKIIDQCDRYQASLAKHPHHIFYALKANSNLAILQILNQQGFGFDIVSMGELHRALKIGANPSHLVFSGVGKAEAEILKALEVGIGCFNIESAEELERINQLAISSNKIAPIALRINPDISAESHPYISTGLKENKFGIPIEDATSLYLKAKAYPHIQIKGVACHIGSQLMQLSPFLAALKKIKDLIQSLKQNQITISHIDLGGGLGVRYTNETPPTPEAYAKAILSELPDQTLLWIEPGRSIIAEAGILVTRVEYIKRLKDKSFCIVDAGMNDLIRPALYCAEHTLQPVEIRNIRAEPYDVVGPICESSDTFAKNYTLAIQPQDLLSIHTVGAYGASMSSQYNSRPRAAEVLVDKNKYHVIRSRERLDDLFSHEHLLSD